MAEEKQKEATKATPKEEQKVAPKAEAKTEEKSAPKAEQKAEKVESKAAPKKKKDKKNVQNGKAFIKATFNNTIITIADQNGNTIAWSSAGNVGFKGSRKSTHYAAQLAATNAAKKAQDQGMRTLSAYVRGPGAGREAAVRAIAAAGLRVTLIKDITPIPHNGCRPAKRRRV